MERFSASAPERLLARPFFFLVFPETKPANYASIPAIS